MKSEELRQRLCDEYPTLCPHFSEEFGDGVLLVPHDLLLAAARSLKTLGFDRLGMLTAVDKDDYFLLVYRLQSRELATGMFLKSKVSREDPRTPSFVPLWAAADSGATADRRQTPARRRRPRWPAVRRPDG